MEERRSYKILFVLTFVIMGGETKVSDNLCKSNFKSIASCRMFSIWNDLKNDFQSVQETIKNHNSTSEITLKVLINRMLPYADIVDNGTAIGFVVDIFETMRNQIGFKAEYEKVEFVDGLQKIEDGEADVMLSGAVSNIGYYNVEIVQPFLTNWYRTYFRRIMRQPSSFYYIKTLTLTIWILSGITVFTLCLLLWLSLKLMRTNDRNVSLATCLIVCLSGYLNQSFEIKVRNTCCRIQIITALMFGYLLSCAINAKLVAQITVSYDYHPISSLDDLMSRRQTEYSLCLRVDSYVYNYFVEKVNGKKILLNEWKETLNGPVCKVDELYYSESLKELLCNNKVILLENEVILDYTMDRYHFECEITSLPTKMYRSGNTFVIDKSIDFELKKKLKLIYLKIKQVGILKRLTNVWIKRQNSDSSQNSVSAVTLEHTHGIILFYLSLLLFSLFVLLLEIIISRSYLRRFLEIFQRHNSLQTYNSNPLKRR